MDSQNVENLKSIGLFQDLSNDELNHLAARCHWRRFRKGERIVEVGASSNEVFFVVEGAVDVVNQVNSGRDVTFTTLEPGAYFGELSAIDSRPRSATVVAKDKCLLASLASDRFRELLLSNAALTFRVLERLTTMIRDGDIRIVELSTMAASQRVYAELLRMARPDAAVHGQWVVRPLPPLREIACRVSTTRETVVRALAQLYRTDFVRRKGRNLYLLDRVQLERRISDCKL